MTAAASPGYARRLGLFSATMAVIGGIIGGGIFRTPAAVAERLGSAEAILAVWALGGGIALLGAFAFGELGARAPHAGGGYVYLRETWGPLPAFLYGWALLLVIATGAIAAVGVTFADYTVALTGLPPGWSKPLAVGAILFLSGVNYLGVKPGAVTQNVFTLLKLLGIVVLIVTGLATVGGAFSPAEGVAHGANATGFKSLGAALVPVLFAYGGWQQTNFIAAEVIHAERTLPRALILGVATVVTTYLLVNAAYLRILGAAGLAASTAPAADVMTHLVGATGGTFIAAVIAVSTFGFLNLVILVTPRVLQAMAADGVFFPHLARLHHRYRTPGAAIIFQSVWAVVLTVSGTFAQLVDYVTFGDWIFFGLTVAGIYVYRRRDGNASSGFRIPGYPVTPALFIAAALYVVYGSVAANPSNAIKGAGLILAGVPVFLYWRARSARVANS